MSNETKTPFSWEAYQSASSANPNLNLLEAFTYDHMTDMEVEALVGHLQAAVFKMQCGAEYMGRVVDYLQTNHITKH